MALTAQTISPIINECADHGHHPRAGSNARTFVPSSFSVRVRSSPSTSSIASITTLGLTIAITYSVTIDFEEKTSCSWLDLSTSNTQPRSRSQSSLIPVDAPHLKPSLDNQSETFASSTSTSTSIQLIPTSSLKFCPPFVACDRIIISPDSDAAKEGMTMIPWSARRRKQRYRSSFDIGMGQGKGKTMFRYYGLDDDPPIGSSIPDVSKKQWCSVHLINNRYPLLISLVNVWFFRTRTTGNVRPRPCSSRKGYPT